MRPIDVGYNSTLFEGETLKKTAQIYLELLPEDVTALVSTGSSGCAIASAMIMLSDRPLLNFYIRKENENAHENKPAYSFAWNSRVHCIVDDFICTGKTIDRILEYTKNNFVTQPKYILVSRDYSHYTYPLTIKVIDISRSNNNK